MIESLLGGAARYWALLAECRECLMPRVTLKPHPRSRLWSWNARTTADLGEPWRAHALEAAVEYIAAGVGLG
jgi:hypothetical protein